MNVVSVGDLVLDIILPVKLPVTAHQDVPNRRVEPGGAGNFMIAARHMGLDVTAVGAVGADVASHCQPVALRNGVLEARVDSSAWCQALRLRAPELLDGLARALGDDAPRELWLRLG